MAARIRKIHHQQDVREKIRASQIVNYLQKHALSGKGSEYASTRVRAATALLNKCVPDLSAVSTLGKDGKPVDPVAAQPIVHVTVGQLPAAKKGNGHA